MSISGKISRSRKAAKASSRPCKLETFLRTSGTPNLLMPQILSVLNVPLAKLVKLSVIHIPSSSTFFKLSGRFINQNSREFGVFLTLQQFPRFALLSALVSSKLSQLHWRPNGFSQWRIPENLWKFEAILVISHIQLVASFPKHFYNLLCHLGESPFHNHRQHQMQTNRWSRTPGNKKFERLL